MGQSSPSESTPTTPTASGGSSTASTPPGETGSSPSTDELIAQLITRAATATSTSGGLFIFALALILLDGALQAFVMMTATVLAGAGNYVWRFYLEPILAEWNDERKWNRSYKRWRKALVKMRDEKGISEKQKKDLEAKIEKLDRIRAESITTRYQASVRENGEKQ